MRRIIGWIIALLGIAAVALAVWFASLDSVRLRDALAAELSQASGYPIRMNGDLQLQFLPEPGLRVADIRIASPVQGDPNPLARAGHIEIGIDLLETLREQVLVVGSLRLWDVEAWLSRDADGQANWRAASPREKPAEEKPPAIPIDPTPRDFGLHDFQLHFHDAASGRSLTVSSVQATAQRDAKSAPIELDVRGLVHREAFHLSGKIFAKSGQSGGEAELWQADLSLALGKDEAHLGLRGVIGQLPDLAQLDVVVEASSPNPAPLAGRLGGEKARAWARVIGPVELKARVRRDGKQGLSLQDGSLEMGDSEHLKLALSGSVHDLVDGGGFEVEIDLDSSDLSRTLQPLDLGLSELGSARLRASLRGSASAPRAENIRLHFNPQEGLEAWVKGRLSYEEKALKGALALSIGATDLRALADFIEDRMRERTGEPSFIPAALKERPLVQHLLALKPLVISAQLESTGSDWSLIHLAGKAGPVGNDWIEVSGRTRTVWPEPDGFRFRLTGQLDQPGRLPGLAERPVAQIKTLKLAGLFTQSTGAPARIRDIDLRLEALGGVHLALAGSLLLAEGADGESGHLEIDLRAPNLAALGRTWGGSLPEWGPVAAEGHIQGSPKNLQLSGLTTQIGKTRIGGEGKLSRSGEVPVLELKLRADELDLRWALLPPADGASASAMDDATKQGRPGQGSALEAALRPESLQWLSRTGGSLEVRVDRVLLDRDWTARDLAADLRWAKGVLDGPNLSVHWPQGALSLAASLDAGKPTPALSLGVRGTGLHLATLAARLGLANMASGRFETTIDLSTRGSDSGSLAGHLTGGLLMDVGRGSLARRYADAIKLSVDTGPQTGSLPMTCFIAALSVDEGVVRTDALLWDSPKSQVRGAGVVDLPARTIDLLLRPHLKETVAAAITAAVRVKGPLDSPSVRPEPFQTASDLARGLIGRALRVVRKVSPQLSDAVIQLGTTTEKVLSSSGVDVPVVLSLLQDPVDCETVEADPKVQALRAFKPGRAGTASTPSPARQANSR